MTLYHLYGMQHLTSYNKNSYNLEITTYILYSQVLV